jgi:eukaryotic-like serine/threonine-protein kinase
MGSVTGRYRLVEEIGRGGMSIVWRGHDDVLDRAVAVKVLAAGYAGDETFRRRIRREGQVAARLSHPYVGTVYDFGESPEGRPYLVMELIEGVSLAGRLREGPLPSARALTVCGQVAAALAAAHARGLVHRDVKPGNVMVTPGGAKLVDFGISALVDEEPPDELPETVLGTPAYVAPEVVTGSPAGPPADVYALGVLLYRSLTGELPWSADSPTQVLRAHVLTQPRPLPRIDGVPRSVALLASRCLAKEPASRPTAAEVASALSAAARVATGESPHTVELPTVALPAVSLPRRVVARRGVATAVCALLGLLAFAAVVAFSPHPSSHSDAAAPLGRPGGAPAPPASPAAASLACQVVYRLHTDDGHRFTGALTVQNTSTVAAPASALTFALSGGQRIAGLPFTQNGMTVTVPMGILRPGDTGSFPFAGSYQGINPMPTSFALGRTACQASTVGATVVTSTQAAVPAANGNNGNNGGKAAPQNNNPKRSKNHKKSDD